MISDLTELLGLACLIAGVFVLAGLGWALIIACPCLLFIGAGVDDAAIKRAIPAVIARARSGVKRRAPWRRRPKVA